MNELNAIYHLPQPEGLDALIRELRASGYDVIAPILQDRAMILSSIHSVQDLPRGVSDEQDNGSYRVKHDATDQSFFGYNLGPTSWKAFLFPPRRKLWSLTRDGNPEVKTEAAGPYAFFGVRACELRAIQVQDKVFIRDGGDPEYQRRRESLLLVGVHCRTAAKTCFCPSMGTGPDFPDSGLDLLLTEIGDKILIQAKSERGRDILIRLPVRPAGEDAQALIANQLSHTKNFITRSMDQSNIKETIYKSIETFNWEAIGNRCLSCANCTMVCPTCFCSTVEDISDVEDLHAERWQKWDSCFHVDFSYMHGGARRQTTASRYRQWFTHKLASWHDQFGSSGCVGCGRCIAWCPVGIDITAEYKLISEAQNSTKESSS